MKRNIFMAAILVVLLASFREKPGGEGFTVYVDDKIVMQQFGADMDEVKTLSLPNKAAAISIRYYHCGKAGKNRHIVLKNENDKIIRQYRYEDSKEVTPKMSLNLSDFSALTNVKGKIKVFYSSSELPGGRQLFIISK